MDWKELWLDLVGLCCFFSFGNMKVEGWGCSVRDGGCLRCGSALRELQNTRFGSLDYITEYGGAFVLNL